MTVQRFIRSRSVALALVLCGGLACEFRAMKAGKPASEPATLPAGLGNLLGGDTSLRLPALDAKWASVALARPLFSRTRSPAAVLAQAANRPPELPKLVGIISSPGKIVGVFSGAGGRSIIVTEGSDIGAFKVVEITKASVRVSGPAGVELLQMHFEGAQTVPDIVTSSASSIEDVAGTPWASAWTRQ
jgi:hypothetical protein